MEDITCSCHKPAKYVCESHKLYLCTQHKAKHFCKLVSLSQFVKDVRLDKAILLSSLKTLKLENKKSTDGLYEEKRKATESLKRTKKTINTSIDKLIEVTSKKVDAFIQHELEGQFVNIEDRLKLYEQNKKYLEMRDFMKRSASDKLGKHSRSTCSHISKFINEKYLFKDVEIFIEKLKKEVDSVYGYIKTIDFYDEHENIDNYIKEQLTLIVQKENKSYLSSYRRHFYSMAEITNRGIDTQPNSKPELPESRHERRSSSIMVNRILTKRGTELIESSIPIHGDTDNSKPRYLQSPTVDIEEIDMGDFIIEESLIEDDDDDGSSWLDVHKVSVAAINEKYRSAEGKFKSILKDAVEKMSSEVYFNKKNKSLLNGFMKEFVENVQQSSKELLLNFNKL